MLLTGRRLEGSLGGSSTPNEQKLKSKAAYRGIYANPSIRVFQILVADLPTPVP